MTSDGFDFDRVIDRSRTNAIAADGFRSFLLDDPDGAEVTLPCADDEVIPMWVADMAFAIAPVAIEAMQRRIEHPIFGYTVPIDQALPQAFLGWCQRHYGWAPPAEQHVTAAGIVPALFDLVDLALERGDKVVTNTPAYEPFEMAVNDHGCELVTSPLARTGDGEHTFDLDDLAVKLADARARMFVLCHPHNPTGRSWSDDELRTVAELCFANDVLIVSDEIHCDLLRVGRTHTPLAKLYPDSDRIITCMSSSKTFNLAGLGLANVVIAHEPTLAAWHDRHFPVVNPISAAAATAVFEHGDPWLAELRTYLDANFALVRDRLAARLPQAIFHVPDATYLAWIDLGAYFASDQDLTRFFAERTGVLIEGGEKFVADGSGHIRVNLACPRAIVDDAIDRIVDATLAG